MNKTSSCILVPMHTLRKVPLFVVIALLVYMPFHIFLAQYISLFTGGLEVWKIAKDVVLLAGLMLSIGLVLWTKAYRNNKKYVWFLALASIYGLIHLAVWQLNTGIDPGNAVLATAYNSRVLGYALLAWGAVMVYPGKIRIHEVARLLLIVSSIICLLGIIQYVLPKDTLTHAGYSLERGARPAFFIDDKPDLPRIMSTLRDPNSLGAYLILPMTILVLAWLRRPAARMMLSGLLLLHTWALMLTFSRSAWLGALVSILIVVVWNYKHRLSKLLRSYWLVLALAIITLIFGGFLLRDQYFVQNVIFHSDENTTLTDSNELHLDYAQKGIEGIMEHPEGHGPGTAGLVSIRNKNTGMLTENYFIQIGYEVGLVGLMVLLAAMVLVLRGLWLKKGPLSQALIASFAGITICSLLLLTWSNEAVAAQWWLLSGIVLADT